MGLCQSVDRARNGSSDMLQNSQAAIRASTSFRTITPAAVPAPRLRDIAVCEPTIFDSMVALCSRGSGAAQDWQVLMCEGIDQVIPWEPDACGNDGCVLNVDSTISAICVGNGCIQEVGSHNYLISDSFGPCRPIIVSTPTNTWLAHNNGVTAVSQINALGAQVIAGEIIIINKSIGATAERAALLQNYWFNTTGVNIPIVPINIVAVSTESNIGVLVHPLSKTIVVFRH